MHRSFFTFRLATLLCVLIDLPISQADEAAKILAAPSAEQVRFVRAKVLPLLESRCFECHRNKAEPAGSLFLGSRKGMLSGGESGPAIVPGKPDESLIIQAVRYEGFEMPPRTRMPEAEVAILEKWIAEGAVWPEDLDVELHIATSEFPLQQRRSSHWAWQPITDPVVPAVNDQTWGGDPIDAFVLARLEAAGILPSDSADRYTLIRRLYFDLIGLPPTVAEIQSFVSNPANDRDALVPVVDSLLESPHFGERWGRHWLDLVRYAETLGHEFDYPLHDAWRYRDYVIRAFNADVPYDQFVREHIAGDLLQNPRRHPELEYNESIIGTGFWFLHEDKHAPVDVKGEEASKIDNQIDVFSKTFLGMTVACARCHDHKFDAISAQDYYALAGFLQSSRRQSGWLDPKRIIETRVNALTALRQRTGIALQKHVKQNVSEDNIFASAKAAVAQIQASSETSEATGTWSAALKETTGDSDHRVTSFPAFLASQPAGRPVAESVSAWIRSKHRTAANGQTTVFADFSDGLPEGWFTYGQAFSNTIGGAAGQLNPEWQGDHLTTGGVPGISSASLSTELEGMLSSPTFELNHPEILVRVSGDNSRVRIVIDGYLMYEFNALLFHGMKQDIKTEGEPRWLRLAGDLHRYQGHRMHLEFLDDGHGWFKVHEIQFCEKSGSAPPQTALSHFNSSLIQALQAGGEFRDQDAALRVWSHQVADSVQAAGELILQELIPAAAESEFGRARRAWGEAAGGIPRPVSVLAICDGTPEDERIFIRGNHKNLGKVAPRNILTALRPSRATDTMTGSGRLQLAEDVLSDQNPLTSRVMANRIWHHLFGAGLVKSTDNLGVLGEKPTHPELLDHLAMRFRKNGWSVKGMVRAIVLSRTYRMSSTASAAADQLDPTNALLHKARIRRLEGEAVRDAMLAVSGRLDRKLFGAPVPQHLTAFMQGRGRPRTNGPVDGDGRRSIYLAVNRNFLSPFMLAFDVPAPVSTIGRRTSSNVPAQALMLLNNEFVNQQAALWASRLLTNQGLSAQQRIAQAWFELLGHPASDEDLQLLLEFANTADSDAVTLAESQLADICHVLMNSKEFTFLR